MKYYYPEPKSSFSTADNLILDRKICMYLQLCGLQMLVCIVWATYVSLLGEGKGEGAEGKDMVHSCVCARGCESRNQWEIPGTCFIHAHVSNSIAKKRGHSSIRLDHAIKL